MRIRDGYNFALGVALFTVLVVQIIPGVLSGIHLGYYDDSDNILGFIRSGLKVRIDHLSGCEYLETWSGSITPRLDRDGKQVCR